MKNYRHRQRGAHTVEFAFTGLIFFMLLFGVIEFGRFLYAWQMLDESSRRAARLAVVCPINPVSAKHVAVFNNPGTAGESPLLNGLSDANVGFAYLDRSGNTVDPAAQYDDIRFVRAFIHDYTHTLMIPLLPEELRTFTLPDIATVLPRESLGVWPGGTGCLGSYM